MTVRQHSFYLEDEDWTALRHYCLDHGLSVSSFIAQAARDAVDDIKKAEKRVPRWDVTPSSGVPFTDAVATTGAKITTATGAPATIPVNPIRAVPKPTPKKKAVRS